MWHGQPQKQRGMRIKLRVRASRRQEPQEQVASASFDERRFTVLYAEKILIIVSSEVIPSYKVIVDRPYILRTEELICLSILFVITSHCSPKELTVFRSFCRRTYILSRSVRLSRQMSYVNSPQIYRIYCSSLI